MGEKQLQSGIKIKKGNKVGNGNAAPRVFHGRVIIGGEAEGKALVSHEGFNPLAAYKKALILKSSKAICDDQNNVDLYKKRLDGSILCLPQVIGSTAAGLVIQSAAELDIQPKAMLFSRHIDSLAASGVVLAEIWQNKRIITIDLLGDEFLEYVSGDNYIKIKSNGDVLVYKN